MNHPLHTVPKKTAFKMNGSIYTLTTLELHVTDTEQIATQLRDMAHKAPHFFDQTPVILSFDQLPSTEGVDLTGFRHLLHRHGMVLVAVRGGSKSLLQSAAISGIAWLPSPKQSTPSKNRPDNVVMMNQQEGMQPMERPQPLTEASASAHKTLFIDQPVRSGQQIYSPGDMVISASVSSGAELLAEGSIHVYGTLRGRALAGIKGETAARIFCRQFEAELISINGCYQMPPSLPKENDNWGEAVQIALDEKRLHIQKL